MDPLEQLEPLPPSRSTLPPRSRQYQAGRFDAAQPLCELTGNSLLEADSQKPYRPRLSSGTSYSSSAMHEPSKRVSCDRYESLLVSDYNRSMVSRPSYGPLCPQVCFATVLEQRVSEELNAFMRLVSLFQSSGDRSKRLAVVKFVQDQVVAELGVNSGTVALPYGSFRYGLYLPWASDLDIVVTDNPPRSRFDCSGGDFSKQKEESSNDAEVAPGGSTCSSSTSSASSPGGSLLDRLASRMEQANCLATSPVIVPRARVPFLQIWAVPALLPENSENMPERCKVCVRQGQIGRCPAHAPVLVQISLAVKEHLGLVTSQYVFSLLKAMPALRPLVLVLKHILVSAGLSNAFKGGLSSHSTLLLVVAFLRNFHPRDHSKAPLGRLLLGLLGWYGESFESFIWLVSPGEVKSFRKRKETEKLDMLHIVDPMEITSNVARSCWRWGEVKLALNKAKKDIENGQWWPEIAAAVDDSNHEED